jgi:hypothetical protein
VTKLKIFLIIFIFVTLFSCFSETKTIKIDEVEILIEYPNEMIIVDDKIRDTPIARNEELVNKYGLAYGYEKIDSEFLSWYDLENKDELLKKLKNKEDVIIYGNKNAGRDFIINEGKIVGEERFISTYADYSFAFQLYIIKDNFYFEIVVEYFDPFRAMQEKYPQYFEYQVDDTYVWKNPNEVFKMIMDGDEDAPEELVKLYKYFQQIKESIKFY